MAVPEAGPYNRSAADAGLGKLRPFIPVPLKRGVEFRFQKFLDEAANAPPYPGFQGIEPIVPKEKRPFGCIRRRLYGIRFYGVISIGALTPIRFEQTNWRLRHLQIPTTSATAPRRLSIRSLKKRRRHLPTVCSWTPSSAATVLLGGPSAQRRTIRQRSDIERARDDV
jgi:hypothetical protein